MSKGKGKDNRAETRDAVFSAPTLIPVATPEWPEADGKMFVRIMPPSALADVKKVVLDLKLSKEGSDGDAAALVGWCITFTCDADGRPMFRKSDSTRLMADIAFGPQERLAATAMDFNGYSKRAGDDAAKNSKPTRS